MIILSLNFDATTTTTTTNCDASVIALYNTTKYLRVSP